VDASSWIRPGGSARFSRRSILFDLWAQAAIAALLVLSGKSEQLVAYVVVVMLLFSSLAVGAVVVLRIRRPIAFRPYRAWGYPVTPVAYVVFSLLVVAYMLYEESSRTEALWGMAMTLLGLPVFWSKCSGRGKLSRFSKLSYVGHR
jgi:amino acid transporter